MTNEIETKRELTPAEIHRMVGLGEFALGLSKRGLKWCFLTASKIIISEFERLERLNTREEPNETSI